MFNGGRPTGVLENLDAMPPIKTITGPNISLFAPEYFVGLPPSPDEFPVSCL
jgi:hypothetical protein